MTLPARAIVRSPSAAVARVACALAVAGMASNVSAAAPVLRSAEARIAFQSPTSCDVDLALGVEGAVEIEHRLEIAAGGRGEIVAIHGAAQVGEVRVIGRTRVLVLRPEASIYTLRYTVTQAADRADRCPLWVPAVPSDGRTRAVQLLTRIPAGATPVGTMPAFAWSGNEGAATLGNLPAFVHVPYALPGAPAPWNIARVMDIVSVVTLAGATAAWAHRRRPH